MKAFSVVFLLAAVALAGCAELEESSTDDVTLGDADPTDGNATASPVSNATESLTVALLADVINGTAPMQVNFTLDGDAPNATWSLDFGDGNETEGTGLPATAAHTYGAGDFTALLSVVDGNRSAEGSVAITAAAAAEAARTLPETTHWEFGPSLGCAGDTGTCISLETGEDGIDGFFVDLGEAYWGLQLTSTVDNARHDSDCWWLDDGGEIIGSANNEAAPCMGIVPEGAAQLFIYSYAEPSLAQTVDVALP